MTSRKMAAVVLAATMTGALGMSACAPQDGPETTPSAQSTSANDSSALLTLNDSLRNKLGDAYSDSWIEDNQLHVAVTTDAAAAIVAEAGAVATLVTIDAAQLETAVQAVSKWQANLPDGQGAAIHKIVPDGRRGTLTIYVASDKLDAVAKAAETDKPAGDVPLVIKESTGLTTAL